MDSDQEDRFGTLLKVDLFLSRNATALAINPLFASTDTELDTIRADIFANDVLALRDLTGFTLTKAEKRIELETMLYLVCNGTRAHFAGLNDMTNKRMVDLEKSYIETISEEKLNTEAEIVWKIADPIKATLGPNQVTAANVNDLQTIRQEFVAMMKVNRAEEGSSKAAREKIVTLFQNAFNTTLKKLDELMMPFASTNAALYSEYQTARMIDNSGGGSSSAGYTLENYTVPAGGSVTFGNTVAPETEMYFRNLGEQQIFICTTDGTTGPCTTGFVLDPHQLFTEPFSSLGLNPALPQVQFTNHGAESVIVRAGAKDS